MAHPREPDPLAPVLHLAEVELEARLHEACARQEVTTESTGELMRLEETLIEAARVAKQTVSLRRRIRTRTPTDTAVQTEPGPERRHDDTTAERDDATGAESSVRDLVDERGVQWQVWAVTPNQMHARSSAGEQLGEYGDGWLAFEAAGGGERRRLPHYPASWLALPDEELRALLARAEPVKQRRRWPNLGSEEPRA
jgi:hypothetical protein